jgi:hypothetical protein
MRKTARLWLAALLLAGGIAASAAADMVSVIETRSLPLELLPAPKDASHELKLSLYSFKGSRWLPADITGAVLDALPILSQCGVAVTSVEFRILDAPLKFRFFSTPVSRELLREYAVAKPALLFVDDTYSQPAYDAEAIGLSNAETRPELTNTIWFAYGAHDLPFAIAHELVHVLSDNGDHSDAPNNLMRPETAPSNTRLTDVQCNRMRTAAEANGLLKRRPGGATLRR